MRTKQLIGDRMTTLFPGFALAYKTALGGRHSMDDFRDAPTCARALAFGISAALEKIESVGPENYSVSEAARLAAESTPRNPEALRLLETIMGPCDEELNYGARP